MPDVADSSGELLGTHNRSETVSIWLVDDSENFRLLLAALLEDEGGLKCTRQFSCAEQVLAALAKESGPDIILLDNRMPGMGGLAAIAPIMSLAPDTRVLMLTTFGDMQVKAQAFRDGASDFLLKSFGVVEIAERIRQAHARPKRMALEISVPNGISTVWPSARASDVTRVGIGSEQTQPPEFGRRSAIDKNSQGLLMRGVHLIRAWVGQPVSKNPQAKAI